VQHGKGGGEGKEVRGGKREGKGVSMPRKFNASHPVDHTGGGRKKGKGEKKNSGKRRGGGGKGRRTDDNDGRSTSPRF